MPPPPEFEEGILVNFGTDETGFGLIEPAPLVEASAPSAPSASMSAQEEALLTQETEEAPVVRRVDPNVEIRRREQAEADRIRREALEAERIRRAAEEEERRRVEAEQQRQADITNRTRNALAGSRNAGSESGSEGTTGGAGNQGVLTGSLDSRARGEGGSGTGNSGTGSGSDGSAVSYDLGGRRSQGALPIPRYDSQTEGRVVVEISVDREGRVTQATAGFRGSTTLDEDLLKIARDAAMQARFASDPNAPATQRGTITYNFILR